MQILLNEFPKTMQEELHFLVQTEKDKEVLLEFILEARLYRETLAKLRIYQQRKNFMSCSTFVAMYEKSPLNAIQKLFQTPITQNTLQILQEVMELHKIDSSILYARHMDKPLYHPLRLVAVPLDSGGK